jgi:hypothetical protein
MDKSFLALVEQDHILRHDFQAGVQAPAQVFKGTLAVKANVRWVTNIVPIFKGVGIDYQLGHDCQPSPRSQQAEQGWKRVPGMVQVLNDLAGAYEVVEVIKN